MPTELIAITPDEEMDGKGEIWINPSQIVYIRNFRKLPGCRIFFAVADTDGDPTFLNSSESGEEIVARIHGVLDGE